MNRRVNNGDAGDSRRYDAHYDVTVMIKLAISSLSNSTIEND